MRSDDIDQVPKPTDAEVDALEKAAWDANADRALVWYRDEIDRLLATVRALEQQDKELRHAANEIVCAYCRYRISDRGVRPLGCAHCCDLRIALQEPLDAD